MKKIFFPVVFAIKMEVKFCNFNLHEDLDLKFCGFMGNLTLDANTLVYQAIITTTDNSAISVNFDKQVEGLKI
jgi:hypothetical protein